MSAPAAGDDLESLFARACELEGDARERFVASQSPTVVRRLRTLLEADARAPQGFLREPAAPTAPRERRIGRYKLLRLLGEGGMGTVWLAEQEEPVKRLVALKTVRVGRADDAMLARIQAERQALALVNHPGIAQFHDGGATDSGLPYFVMEHVEGPELDHYCDDHALSLRGRLALVAEVCDAVQHAHQKGILHRDLKCSNVLVAERDGRPVPKVIDFGIARALAGSLAGEPLSVAVVRIVGTREGMSPEQARGEDVDTRADVFGLGAMLYELACGAPPFDPDEHPGLEGAALVRVWLEREPPPPDVRLLASGARAAEVAELRGTTVARLARALHGDVGWIAARALARDRALRYASASELAADLRAHLADHPVQAAPPGRRYRARKFVRRHRVAVSLAAALSVATLAGLVISLTLLARSLVAEESASIRAARGLALSDVLERALEDFVARPEHADAVAALAAGPLADVDGPPAVEAGVWTSLGRLLLRLGENERARRYFLSAQVLQQGESGVGAYERFETLDGLLQAERRVNGGRAAAEYVPLALAAAREALGDLEPDEENAVEALLRFEAGADVPGAELVAALSTVLERLEPELGGRHPHTHALARVAFGVCAEMIARDVPEAEAYAAELDRRARELLQPHSYARFLWALANDLLQPGHEHPEAARAYLAELDATLATFEPQHWLREQADELRARLGP